MSGDGTYRAPGKTVSSEVETTHAGSEKERTRQEADVAEAVAVVEGVANGDALAGRRRHVSGGARHCRGRDISGMQIFSFTLSTVLP